MSQTASYGKWTQTNVKKAFRMVHLGDTVSGRKPACAEDKEREMYAYLKLLHH